MAYSINKVTLLGRLGQDPDARTMQTGDMVVNLSVATSESWKDKNTGQKNERTQWHRVVIFSQGLARIVEQHLKKGDQVYIEGQLETRKWTDQSGQEKYTTEVVLRPYKSEIVMLGSGKNDQGGGHAPAPAPQREAAGMEDDDEIPF